MRKDMMSIALGLVAVALSFTPLIPLQLAGVVLGALGICASRRARREDYRRDLTCSIGLVVSIAGVLLCALTPIVYLVGNVLLAVAG